MEWLPSEEIALLLATLVAFGVLVLGTLELLWPTRPRSPRRVPRPVAAPQPAVVPDRPPVRPELAAADDRASVALRVGRKLLEQALQDPDPAADRRVRLTCRAIACLTRGIEAAPDDRALREALAEAHQALAKADREIALRRLAAEMPWRPVMLAHAASGSDAR